MYVAGFLLTAVKESRWGNEVLKMQRLWQTAGKALSTQPNLQTGKTHLLALVLASTSYVNIEIQFLHLERNIDPLISQDFEILVEMFMRSSLYTAHGWRRLCYS